MKSHLKFNHYQRGFSFVELAVVLLAVGMVLGMSLSAGMTQMKMIEVTSTQAKLEKIRDALNAFRDKHGRYPCPAQEYAVKDASDYASFWDWVADYGSPASYKTPQSWGEEYASCANHPERMFGAVLLSGITDAEVAYSGSVPFQALNLNPSVAIDSWGNRITYMVDIIHTVKSSIGPGMIDVVDEYGNSKVQSSTQGKAIFALISHGANANGAYPANSISRNSCSTTTNDHENCDDDAVILDANLKDSVNASQYNDDYVLWQTQTRNTKEAIKSMPKVVSVAAGGLSTCAILENGSLWCMGNNVYENLATGLSSSSEIATPTQVLNSGIWKKISRNIYNGCGIKNNDTLWCWGYNNYGEVGDGTTVNKTAPVQVSGGGTWKDVSSGAYHTCAIKNDDTLWCWGYNNSGQVGDGTSTTRTTPRQIVSGTTWQSIDLGFSHSCALKSDNTFWCWGYNAHGQLGTGNTSNQNVPTQISGGGVWKQISTDETRSCGIKLDDTLWCWGTGLLGNGNNAPVYTPTAIASNDTWLQIAAGGSHICGIKTNGTLWCWGNDDYMQIGDMNNALTKPMPTEVYGNTTWKQVSLGWMHTCGIKTNDTLWCWGKGSNGQLGYGFTYNNQYVPNNPYYNIKAVFGVPYPVVFP